MHTRAVFLTGCATIAAFVIGGCTWRRGEVGSKGNPIKFYFMPLKGDEAYAKNAPIIKEHLEKSTGMSVETIHSPDFVSIVKAFGQGKADFAFINTLGYLLARDFAKAEAPLVILYGDVYKTYRGEIVARVDGPIKTPTDLVGKTIAFADPYSASGYLYVLKFLRDHNIKPGKTVFAGSHKKAIEMVYKGEVDAVATFHSRPEPSGAKRDARIELTVEHPDVLEKVRIIALTDEIPNGPVAARHNLPPEIKTKITNALVEFAGMPIGRKALFDLYNATGFAPASGADYDGVQGVVKSLGKTIQQMVPGGEPYYKTYIVPGLE